MARPRHELVSLDDTPYYHCVSRCVRRAFLCGDDPYSGRDYSHRKNWVKERLAALSDVFAIELCAYAVMSNHYHLVVCVDREQARAWSESDVIERWLRLFKGPLVIQRYVSGITLSSVEKARVLDIADEWRKRLSDISWYMRCLNEHLARRANAEDECTGRFWEGRFKCQALLDEAALITAMTYVDLNPIRAGLARDLVECVDTSVEQRLRGIMGDVDDNPSIPLKNFSEMKDDVRGIPFNVQDYLALVDWSGRAVRIGKAGAISSETPPILNILGINPDEWLPTVTALQRRFELVIGSPRRMRQRASITGRAFYRGYRVAQKFYLRA